MRKLSECRVWWWSKDIAKMIAERFGEAAEVSCYDRKCGGYAGTTSGCYIYVDGKKVAEYRQRTNDIKEV